MRRRYLLGIVLLISGVLVACSGSAQQPIRPLYSGSEGIMLSFPQQNALQQYGGDIFSLSVRLANDGAADINASNPGIVTATFDPALLRAEQVASSSAGITQPPIDTTNGEPGFARAYFAARGRSLRMPVGDIAFVDFTFTARPLADNRQKASIPVVVQACYPYRTTFVTDICVDRDVNTRTGTSACAAQAVSAQPQGAPVAVVSVTPRYTRVGDSLEARYEFTLDNLKDGIIYWPGDVPSTEACMLDELERSGYGVAAFTATISGVPLRCGLSDAGQETVQGVARFDRRRATVVCRLPATDRDALAVGDAYLGPLIAEVRYFYIQSVTAKVEVIR